MAKHSSELAEVVVEADIFPFVSQHLTHPCPGVGRNAAGLIRDIVKQSLELTQLVVNTGAIGKHYAKLILVLKMIYICGFRFTFGGSVSMSGKRT